MVADWIALFLRWGHFVAGFFWIGLLYFFNAVSSKLLSFEQSNFMASLDPQVKLKVYPNLMPKALWWFRWGALWTVVFGILLYGYYFPNHWSGSGTKTVFLIELAWLAVIYVVNFAAISMTAQDKNKPLHNLLFILAIGIWIFAVASPFFMGADAWIATITVGGGFGILMLLNVWGIIWRIQKKVIQANIDMGEGKPAPPDLAKISKMAAVASRTNFWLSIPMLFLMAAASHMPRP